MNKLTLVGFLWIRLWVTPHTQTETTAVNQPVLVTMISEAEYETAKTLPAFANLFLRQNYSVVTILEDPERENSFPGVTSAASQLHLRVGP